MRLVTQTTHGREGGELVEQSYSTGMITRMEGSNEQKKIEGARFHVSSQTSLVRYKHPDVCT